MLEVAVRIGVWLALAAALFGMAYAVGTARMLGKETQWLRGEVLKAREDGRLLTTRITEMQQVGMQWVDNAPEDEDDPNRAFHKEEAERDALPRPRPTRGREHLFSDL